MHKHRILRVAAVGLCLWVLAAATLRVRAADGEAFRVGAAGADEYQAIGLLGGLSPFEVLGLPLRLRGRVLGQMRERDDFRGLSCRDYVTANWDALIRVRPVGAGQEGMVFLELKRVPEVVGVERKTLAVVIVNTYLAVRQNSEENRAIAWRRLLVSERDRTLNALDIITNRLKQYGLDHDFHPDLPGPKAVMREAMDKAVVELVQARARQQALAGVLPEARKIELGKPAPAVTAAVLGRIPATPKTEQDVADLTLAVDAAAARADLEVKTATALVEQLTPAVAKERKELLDAALRRDEYAHIAAEAVPAAARRDALVKQLDEVRIKTVSPDSFPLLLGPEELP